MNQNNNRSDLGKLNRFELFMFEELPKIDNAKQMYCG